MSRKRVVPRLQRPGDRLRGKVALITGATRGIGLALARALAGEACSLALAARDRSHLADLSRELHEHNVEILTSPCDIRKPASIDRMVAAIRKRFTRLDILINNAGVAHPPANVDTLAITTWQQVIATNLTGMFLVTRAALPLMKSGATIVNNLSISARRVFPGLSAYNASKHGGLGFTSTLREELRPRGIRVIALLPGATDSEIWDHLWPQAPRSKMIRPETLARAVVDAICVDPDATVEELVILPRAGTL